MITVATVSDAMWRLILVPFDLQARLVFSEADEILDSDDNGHYQKENSDNLPQDMYFTRRQFEQPPTELETNMLNVRGTCLSEESDLTNADRVKSVIFIWHSI